LDEIISNFTENDSKIFKEEFDDFLPKKIFDFHVHLWKEDFYNLEISNKRRKQNPFLNSGINQFTYNDFEKITKKLFYKKNYYGLLYGLPVIEMDIDKNNEYIAMVNNEIKGHGLFIPKPDLKEVPENFFKNRFVGFKPYPDLVRKTKIDDSSKIDIDTSIFDFVSKNVLEFCHEFGLILQLHIPRKERLNDKRNIQEIESIGKKYPRIKIVLAHAGRSYCYNDIKYSIKHLKKIKNLYVDTAMINNFLVNEVLIKELGPDKIFYGSDLVVAALKGKNIEINDKHYFVTNSSKPWSLSSSEMELNDFTFFIYEIIRAIKIATDSLDIRKIDIEKIFYSNAMNLIEEITQGIKV